MSNNSGCQDTADDRSKEVRPDSKTVRDTVPLSEAVESQAAKACQSDFGSLSETFGRYRVVKQIGQGAMGAVYLAHDTQLDRQVALKIPKFSATDGPELLERFYREARSAAMLRSDNICPVYDVGEIDGTHYIAMAFIEGRPLSAFVTADQRPPEFEIAETIRILALALAKAHEAGIIHRDLKPSNIMIDADGEPVVMDFGLARQIDKGEDTRLTQTGAILGSPAYMSPEQVEGRADKIGPATDIYSLGVILYELLCGRLPFQGSMAAVLGQIALDTPPPPSTHRAEIDSRLEVICLKMMARETGQRYASMTEVADALSDFRNSGSDHAASKPATATRIVGDYVIQQQIGQRGSGTVYKAKHRETDTVVALTVFPPDSTGDPSFIQNIRQVAETASKLSHPNIVQTLESGEQDGTYYLVTEYTGDNTLESAVRESGPLPVLTAVDYILHTARGLEHAHQQGVVHRNLQPAKLLLETDGSIRILEMGLAPVDSSPQAEGVAAKRVESTEFGTGLCSADFMSPEQALNAKTVDHRTDIYSLGCLLYYLLTGKPVYGGETSMEKLVAHREQPIPSLRAVRDDIPSDFDAIFQRMIAKQADERIQSMTEVIAQLEACRKEHGSNWVMKKMADRRKSKRAGS